MRTPAPLLPLLSLLVLASAGCSDQSFTTSAKCDGLASRDEKSVDAPFDADGDGYFDIRNPDCVATYGEAALDCDDLDAEIHPGADEVVCDGADNDCSEDTPDVVDNDLDGVDACTDCDDTNNTVKPGAVEIDCDGKDNDCDAATPDGDADADGDGFNACDDCDDHNSAQNPGEGEFDCNGVDDDCDEATPDGDDLDGDGFIECDDCNDNDRTVFPGNDEVCDDGLDNNCNGQTDENCSTSYTDTWTLDTYISYSCAYGLVAIGFNQVTVIDNYPALSISVRGAQPGTMSGLMSSPTDFEVLNVLSGTCNETYTFTGTFTDPNTFVGDFSAEFSGGQWCFDCQNQYWTGITGIR